ncbi:MAG: DUF512 domain-containing protein [Clostridia bacterium]|nr:DUF512 domain-containing protein [Clostridia bacterium]
MVRITGISSHSHAAHAGLRENDVLISINDHPIRDVLDYRFYLAESTVRLVVLRGRETITCTIHKHQYDDIGLDFETALMDKKNHCENKCVFCFIDQLPRGMRETLYFKDDDSRLSFLHGNYITLTNLKDEDIDRIIEMHISPINVSVHTTNPELRVRMMKNKRAGEVLKYLRRLADAGIDLCGQIVLCKGLNDGEELFRTIKDLSALYPAMSSVSIVPAGLTKYRDGLYHLDAFTPEECKGVIEHVDWFRGECIKRYGTPIFMCSDEFYITAGMPLPGADYYDGYPQIENGVGMIRSFVDEAADELVYLKENPDRVHLPDVPVHIACGQAAYEMMQDLTGRIREAFPDSRVEVHCIVNHFFGESITVSGLMTGQDLILQLKGNVQGQLLLPENALRAQKDLFLDDLTPQDLEQRLGVQVRICPNNGMSFVDMVLGCEE